MKEAWTLEVILAINLKAGSHDPIFGSVFFSGIVSAHRNVIVSVTSLNLNRNRIQESDRVNQPLDGITYNCN